MIRITLLIVLTFCIRPCYSQDYILSRPKQEKAYLYWDNPLLAIVEGYSCKSVVLTTNNGKIRKNGCSYSLRPEKYGSATIVISVKKGNTIKKVKEVYIGVDSIPPPVAFVGNSSGGSIKKGLLKAQSGIGAWVISVPGFCMDYRVISFTTIIFKKDSIAFSRNITSNTFDDEIYKAISVMQQNETILFTSIVCIGPSGKKMRLKPIEFSIEE